MPRRGDGSTKLVALFGKQEAEKASGPGKTRRRTNAMDDRYVSGSSETAGRNRYPRSLLAQGESSPMLKPLMFSLSLAVALGICSVSKAGGFDSNCTTCGLASPQGVVASPQGCAMPCDPCATCALAHPSATSASIFPRSTSPVRRLCTTPATSGFCRRSTASASFTVA